jgi:hypothetical protein
VYDRNNSSVLLAETCRCVDFFVSKYGVFNAQLTLDGIEAGTARFETFKEQEGDEEYLAADGYPHVRNNCVVCDDTHEDEQGLKFRCRNCVCLKCNGTGVKNGTNTPCKKMCTV